MTGTINLRVSSWLCSHQPYDTMSRFWRFLLLCTLWGGGNWSHVVAQSNGSDNTTSLPASASLSSDSVQTKVAKPKSLTFTGSTDQRFYFFNDTRNDNGRRKPVSVYGIRAGFLFPSRRENSTEAGGMRAAFKAGLGFYFVNQFLNRPGLLPATSEAVTRHLRIATAFFEPYLYRKKSIEISLPIEFGYGHSRYERNSDQAPEVEVARGVFLPAGVGVSASYQFPNLRWFRPFHWFGFNVLGGYRFILKKDVPNSQINYNGLYISVGPSFFLENLTADIKNWRRNRKKK
ncbi:MAG: hypothetical protein JWP57_1778 [Spirosoma sp.]|nr:hypothetical protein [Spirosoma sp.]